MPESQIKAHFSINLIGVFTTKPILYIVTFDDYFLTSSLCNKYINYASVVLYKYLRKY